MKKRLRKKYRKIMGQFYHGYTFGVVIEQPTRQTVMDTIMFYRACRGHGKYRCFLSQHDNDVRLRQLDGKLTLDEALELHRKVCNLNNPNNVAYHHLHI